MARYNDTKYDAYFAICHVRRLLLYFDAALRVSLDVAYMLPFAYGY